ncbi:MAG: PQQ-dependent sugar dehydrogenase [Chloroflexota bacterium]|nr:PQQ-dependent sugar dehydrogenase [Chloroflexota bacterium]
MASTYRHLACLLAVIVAIPLVIQAGPARSQDAAPARLDGDVPGDPQIQLVEVAAGLHSPVNVAFPPDGSGRIFVVEQTGTIRIINSDGTVVPEPFLDLTLAAAQGPGEQGLLGLAFHPDFAANGRFFVDFNNLDTNGAITVTEFVVSATDPNAAGPESERPLLVIEIPFRQHNGGTLRFGPDGYLYIATGDGGWQGDAYDNAQSRFSLLGKILRIDVDGGATGQPYGIPADNPFAGPGRYDNPYPGQAVSDGDEAERQRRRGTPGRVSAQNRNKLSPVRQEIWALGLRNPWQFSFDPDTGDVYIADVGASAWEEINLQPAGSVAGQNYGWDWLEGAHCFPDEIEECPRQQVGVLPVAEYEHGDDGCAVIGLGVYRGEDYPALDGIYFSGDFCTGEIRGLQRDDGGTWQFQTLLDTALSITGAGQDADGLLYVTAITGQPDAENNEAGNGSLWKLVSADDVPPGATTAPLGQPSGGDSGGGLDDEAAAPAGEEPAPADAVTAAATPTSGGMTVVMAEMYFEPDLIAIPADTDVRILLENRGALPHNFQVRSTDISIDVEPGATAEAVLNLPPGRYRVICNVPGHRVAGMVGSIVVE